MRSPASVFLATVSNLISRFNTLLHLSTPPASNHLVRFLHWLTSKCSRRVQPSTTASTPTPVTLTQPLTDSSRRSRRWRPIARRDESDTADPQNESLRETRLWQPRERTSVAVSDNAQQNDYSKLANHSKKSKQTERCIIPSQAPLILSQHLSKRQWRYQ